MIYLEVAVVTTTMYVYGKITWGKASAYLPWDSTVFFMHTSIVGSFSDDILCFLIIFLEQFCQSIAIFTNADFSKRLQHSFLIHVERCSRTM